MKLFKTALRMFLVMTLLTGIFYPLIITLIAQLTMPHLSNGSLVQKGDRIIGSQLIAQNSNDPRYFWPRPSAIDYDPMKPSGGSNLGPTSQKLKESLIEREKKFDKKAPAELLYASGSGLDPHITLKTAYFQIPRVAKARSIDETELKRIVDSLVEGKQLGLLGPQYVNILILNQVLDDR
jgi:potassium-transporting ATPase KdpC subunit